MHFRKEISKWGENLACEYLKSLNYEILERNFLFYGEKIDIVAKDLEKNQLVLIKVKTYSNFKYGNPSDETDNSKQNYIKKAINYYLYENHIKDISIRIDIIEVYIQINNYKINHIKEAV